MKSNTWRPEAFEKASRWTVDVCLLFLLSGGNQSERTKAGCSFQNHSSRSLNQYRQLYSSAADQRHAKTLARCRRRKLIKESDAREQFEWNRKQNGREWKKKGKGFYRRPMRWSEKKVQSTEANVSIKTRTEQKDFPWLWTERLSIVFTILGRVHPSDRCLTSPGIFFLFVARAQTENFFFCFRQTIVRKFESIKSTPSSLSSLSQSKCNRKHCIKLRKQLTSRNLSKSLDVSTNMLIKEICQKKMRGEMSRD